MTVNLSLLGGAGWQFLDNNGSPLSGGLLYTYQAGTALAANTYTSASGVTPNSNPVVLNAAGRVQGEIWLTQGQAYKFVLKTSTGVTLGTYDNVPGANDLTALNIFEAALAAPTGSSLVGFIQSGTGAVAITVQDRLRQTVSVEDFGAVGDGNITLGTGTENHVQFQAAIDSLNGSGTVYIPAGIFKMGLTVNVPSGVTITGAGTYVSFLMVSGTFSLTTGVIRSNGAGGAPTVFENLAVVAQNGGAAAGVIGINSQANGTFIRNVWVAAFPTNVKLANSDNFLLGSAIEETTAGGVGVLITSSDVTIADCVLYNCTSGAVIQNVAYVDGTISINNCRAIACAQNGFYISNSSNVQISNCSVGHSNAGAFIVSGISVVSSSNVAISNFIARLGAVSTVGTGIAVNTSSSNVNITNSQISAFKYGIEFNAVTCGTVTNSNCSLNSISGIYAHGGDQVILSNNICRQNGTSGGSTDAGIYTNNTESNALYSINGNICTQLGVIQDYGIYASVTDNGASSGLTNIVGNVAQFNTVGNITTAGKVSNVYQTGNQ